MGIHANVFTGSVSGIARGGRLVFTGCIAPGAAGHEDHTMKRLRTICLSLLVLLAGAGAAWAQEDAPALAAVASPDGRLVFSLHKGRFGALTWRLRRGDEAAKDKKM